MPWATTLAVVCLFRWLSAAVADPAPARQVPRPLEERRASQSPEAADADVPEDADGVAEEEEEENDYDEFGFGDTPEEMPDVTITNISFTVSAMLMMFFVLNVSALYMVNYRDENIRGSMFKMLETMISIFLAVTLNEAMFGFILDQFLAGREGRGLGLKPGVWAHTMTGFAMFAVMEVALNLCGFRWRDNPVWLYGSRRLLGHISAFAGILTFSHLQRAMARPGFATAIACVTTTLNMYMWNLWRKDKHATASPVKPDTEQSPETYALVAEETRGVGRWQVKLGGRFEDYPSDINTILVEGAMSMSSEGSRVGEERKISFEYQQREYVVRFDEGFKTGIQTGRHGGSKERAVRLDPERSERDQTEWKEEIWESELDATCLTISYLLVANLRWLITGVLPDLHAHDTGELKPGQTMLMAEASLVLVAAVIVVTFMRSTFGHLGSKHMLVLNVLQTLLAMCTSWCALFIGSWVIQACTSADPEMAMVFNAFATTAVAVVVIVVLDSLADRMGANETIEGGDPEPRGQPHLDPVHSGTLSDMPTQFRAPSEGDHHMDTVLIDSFQSIADRIQDKNVHEKALRKLIESAGLMVGIVWEKALAAANVSLENYVQITRRHSVITKGSLAFALLLVIMPAYLKYLVPVARRDDEYWARLMRTEDLQSVMEKLKNCDYKTANELLERLDTSLKHRLLRSVDEDIRDLAYVKTRLKQMKAKRMKLSSLSEAGPVE